MKVLGFMPLHYGKEYLEAAIKSVDPCIDELLILYTSKPSYGHSSNIECPETEEELKEIAFSCAKNLTWLNITNDVRQEGEHRGAARRYAELHKFDQMISFDADEIWDTNVLRQCLKDAEEIPFDRIKVSGWKHFWKGFNWYCEDGFLPVRISNINVPFTKEEGCLEGSVYHFGYAQSLEIIQYKWSCHGHQNELRPNWIEEKYIKWVPGMDDVHPVAIGLWNPKSFNKEELPEILRTHKNYSKWMI